ncbi:MAG: serine/threonine-protein kinase [Pseudomonadota bacterium]
MSNINWQSLEAAFSESADLSDEEQAAYLARLQEDDPELAAHLAGMLSEDKRDDGPLVAPVAAAVERLSNPWVGQSIGPYVLEEHIASGGMGSVYLARRNDAAYEQTVAVKILSAGVFGEEAQLRFRTERQILANLKHPNIAVLHDGGSTGQGIPYLVMEYIDGSPIDVHCEDAELGLDARIHLFLKVCNAVELAHRNLVVHRDIKPSNILVTAAGEPKLLDFGIAKPLDPAMGIESAQTRVDRRAMTPEYASPEQVLGQPVTTATDVYGLGLLLYRLLSGNLPYDLTGLRPSEIEKTICETPPPPPSRSATSVNEGTTGDATQVALWRRALVGDLDSIVMCALQKAPEHRYPSVRALADDLRAYLNHLPISGREPVWTYRLHRFIQRHRLAVSFGVVTALLLAGFTVYITNQARLLAVEKRTAEQSLDYLVGLFRAADPGLVEPGVTIGPDSTINDLFALGSQRVREDLQGQPRVKARLLTALGMAHQSIGNYDLAASLFQEALALQRELGLSEGELAETLNQQGWLLFEQGDYRNADLNLSAALEIYRSLGPTESPGLIEAAGNLANTKGQLGQIDDAVKLMDEAQAIERRLYAPDDLRLAANMHNSAILFWEMGEYEKALTIEKEALALWQAHLEPDHPNIAAGHNFLATLLRNARGDYPAARTHYELALGVSERVFGPDHANVARDMMDLAVLELEVGNLRRAETLNRRAANILGEAFGEGYLYLAVAHMQLADTELMLGDTDAAAVSLTHAAQTLDKTKVPRDRDVVELAALQAQLLLDTGNAPAARDKATNALKKIVHRKTDSSHFRLHEVLADTYLVLRDVPTAKVHLAQMQTLAAAPYLEHHIVQVRLQRSTARVALAERNIEGATTAATTLETLARKQLGPANIEIAEALRIKAQLATLQNNASVAEAYREAADAMFEKLRR